jgi:hypothetical protein
MPLYKASNTAILALANTWTAKQTFSPPANTSALVVSGYSLTGANAQPMLDLSGTWNTTGTPTAIRLNITDTASNANSLLMDLRVGVNSRLRLAKTGALYLGGSAMINGTNDFSIIKFCGNGNGTSANFAIFDNVGARVRAGAGYTWANSSDAEQAADTFIKRPAAAVVSFEAASSAGGTFRAIATTPAQITADQNNYNPGGVSRFQRWSSDASRNVTGLTFATAQVDGQEHIIWNVGSNAIVLVHESASSTAANRFTTSTGADLTLAAGKCACLVYDGTSSRWRAWLAN